MDMADRVLERVKEIYRTVTGTELPPTHRGEAIPAGWDPAQYVRARWFELEDLVRRLNLPVAPLWAPRVDVIEHEREVEFQFELPAVKRDQITIAVEGGRLLVEGARRKDAEHGNGWGYRWQEIPTGMFRREVLVPPGVRIDQMEAKLEEGILQVRFPHLRAPTKKDRIEIH